MMRVHGVGWIGKTEARRAMGPPGWMVALLGVMFAAGVCGCSEPSGWEEPSPDGTHRDQSGLIVVDEMPNVPDQLSDAYSAAFLVSENRPDDFGYPRFDETTVTLPAVSEAAESLTREDPMVVAQELLNDATHPWEDQAAYEYEEAVMLIDVVALPGVPSRTGLDALRDEVMAARYDSDLASAEIWATATGVYGRVVVMLRHFTPATARALADRFGTENLVIQINPSDGLASPL